MQLNYHDMCSFSTDLFTGQSFCEIEKPYTKCEHSVMDWYEKVKIMMKAQGIKNKDLVGSFGPSPSAVSNYLCGIRTPDPYQMKALAEKLHCSIDYIMSDDDFDPANERVFKIILAANNAIKMAKLPLSEEEKISLYQTAFAAGLGRSISEEKLKILLNQFVKIDSVNS